MAKPPTYPAIFINNINHLTFNEFLNWCEQKIRMVCLAFCPQRLDFLEPVQSLSYLTPSCLLVNSFSENSPKLRFQPSALFVKLYLTLNLSKVKRFLQKRRGWLFIAFITGAPRPLFRLKTFLNRAGATH
jgi:hypothetical protein